MRRCVALFLIPTLFSAGAFGAPKKKDKKEAKASGPNMDSSGSDPATQEKSDKGPYRPTGKTGALAEENKTVEEVEEVVKARPRDKRLLFGDFVLGLGPAPWPGPASKLQNQTPDALSLGVVFGGAYDISKQFTIGLRVPVSTATVDVPGSNRTEQSTAFGSPELLAEYRHSFSELTTLPLLFGLGIPLAQGNPDPSASRVDTLAARVNSLADAANGWRDPELYWPKRIPIVLGVGIRHEMKKLSLGAYTKFVFGINIGKELVDPYSYFRADPSLADGKLVLHPVAIRDVTGVGVRWDVLSKLWLGADVWGAYNIIHPIRYESTATRPFPIQFVAEPQVGLRLGKLRPSLGYVWPMGGRLAETEISGIRLHVDFAL